MDGWGWGLGLLGAAISIVFTILVLVIFVMIIVKLVSSRPATTGRGTSGLRVLDELYASGEITRDEYLERKSVLKQ